MAVFLRKRLRFVFVLAFLASVLWGGREFPAGPDEETVPDELLVQFRPGVRADSVLSDIAPGGRSRLIRQLNLHVVQLPARASRQILTQFASHPLVEYAEPNRIRHTLLQPPDDPFYSQQWALQAVEALSAWGVVPSRYLSSATAGTARIKVAVLDTGADCTHADFMNSGGTSTDSAQGGQISFALSQAPVRTKVRQPACLWQDDRGHGTHVAGTIAAATTNGQGVASLGYALELIVFKVLDSSGRGNDGTISNAIVEAADAGADIISLSLGGEGYSQTLQNAINYARQRNSLVIAAAGNSASGALTFPAGANYAVGVAATDWFGNRAWFSNFGDSVDIAAPGMDILSTAPSYPVTMGIQDYASLSGTSMATPHVSALAGLIAMTTPSVSAAVVAQRLQQSASSTVADGGWDLGVGYGTINASNALTDNLRIATVGGVVGQVVDASALPVANAQVSVAAQTVTTDSSGLFRFANLPTGRHVVTSTAIGFPVQTLDAVVPPGADTTLTIVMGSGFGEFTGTVTSGGTPLPGAVVEAVAGGLVTATAIADTNGLYALSVPAGTYDLEASALSKVTGTVTAKTVSANGSLTVDISLPSMGKIAGVVRDPNGNPVPNAQISVLGSNFSTGAVTDLNGGYSTIGLPSGTYTVAASVAGFQDASLSGVAVTEDLVTTVDFQMSYLPTGFPMMLVNAGGGAYTDPAGHQWSADNSFLGGQTYSTGSSITGTNTPELYQTVRFGDFKYQLLLPYGSYLVKLKFAEVYFTEPGQRVFSVTINGQNVLSDFDIVAEAGGALIATDRAFPVSVTGGGLVVEFIPVLSDPSVNAIEISPISITPGNAVLTESQTQQFAATVSGTTNPGVTWSLSPAVGTISSSGLYTAPASITASQTVNVVATSVVNPDTSASATVTLVSAAPIRVNAGGPEITDSAGKVWSADTGFLGGASYSTTASITGTAEPVLYQTLRYHTQNFRYQFVVANGAYNVNLKFAEVYFTQAGQRVFSVLINSQTVLSNFDAVAEAGGPLTAVDRQFPVTVSDGKIVIEFVPGVSDPSVNALEIAPNSGITVGVTPESTTLAPSETRQFTATVSGTANTAVTWSLYPVVGTISSNGLYTAPSNVAGAQTVTVTATSVVDEVAAASATVTLVPSRVVRVNSGGPAYTDSQGNNWSADTGFSGGSPYSTSSSISGTSTPALYQSVRFHTQSFNYLFDVPDGTYIVSLKFAEIYFTSVNQRIFDVAINGHTVLSRFDVVAEAGGPLIAVDRPFPVDVTDGQVMIEFLPVVSDPNISAIEITPQVGVSVWVNPSSVTLAPSQTKQFTATVRGTTDTSVIWSLDPDVGTVSSDGLYTAPSSIAASQLVTVTATSVADNAKAASGTVTLVPSSVVRVNAGGPAYTDSQGNNWSADTGFSGGSPYSTSSVISGTTTPTLYQTVRYHTQSFNYQFAVPNGTYTVNLKFAEIYFSQAGQRIFHVAINGQQVLSSFDAVAEAGGAFIAVDRQFPVTVLDGEVVVEFIPVVSAPNVNALEISPLVVTPGSVVLSDSGSQQFTATVGGVSTTDVSWSMNPAVGTLTSSGLYTAPATVTAAQSVIITATSVSDQAISASATVKLRLKETIRVNSGGSAYTDPQGIGWSADTGFIGGSTYSTAAFISGTNTPLIYQSVRYGQSFRYQFDVADGTHTVTLKFAEIYFTGASKRIFNVVINGQQVLSNFDAVAEAGGPLIAVDRTFTVDVTNGQVLIEFIPVVSDPNVSAIEVSE